MSPPAAIRRRGLAVAPVLFVLLVAGAAGYWSASGSGTATTTLGDPQELVLSAGTPSSQVSPGGSAGVATVASNPNPYEVGIESISLDTGQGTNGFEVDAGHSGCGLSTLDLTTADNGGAGWTVPAKVGSTPGSLAIELSGALTMSAGAANACQGASFTVHLTAAL